MELHLGVGATGCYLPYGIIP